MYNPYNPYAMQAYPQTALNSPQRSENNLIRVTGLDGAKAYQMPPNSTTALFDGGDDIMYIKSTDGAGFPTIRTFEFKPIEAKQPQTADQVTRAEFEELRKAVQNVKQLISTEGNTADSKRK